MRVPKNWIKEYIDLPADDKVLTDKMSMIGHMLDKTEEVEGELVWDFELRGNRADCYSIFGLAREVHASFGGALKLPEPETKLPYGQAHSIAIKADSDVVQRFFSCVIENVEVKESPKWLQDRLKQMGIDPINNVVDITNYVMFESNMPLHAFDLDKIGGTALILRKAQKGEKLITFDGSQLTLSAEDVVFAGEDGSVHGLVGIIGGKASGISNSTSNILLECAAYDRVAIRKTMYRHNAQTEAGLRHSHDLSASLCDYALARAAALIMEFAANSGTTQITGVNDYYPTHEKEKVIDYSPSEVTRLGGVEVKTSDQIEILKRLEFKVEGEGDNIKVTAPLFRTDIFASEDIVEEVLRIWGYENIPFTTLSSVIPDPIIQPALELEEKSRDILTALGLNEVITVPFLNEKTMTDMADPLQSQAIPVLNPPTTDYTHLRTNMFANLLDASKKVLERGDNEGMFFEVGKIYFKKDKPLHQPPHKPEFPYAEVMQIVGLMVDKSKSLDFYSAKGLVESYFDEMKIKDIKFEKDASYPFIHGAKIVQGEKILGWVGVIDPKISKEVYDLNTEVYGFLLNTEELISADYTEKSFMPYSDYPAVVHDLSVLVGDSVVVGEMADLIKAVSDDLVRTVQIVEVYEMNDQEKSILFSITYQAKDKTLTTAEVNEQHNKIAKSLEEKFEAKVR
jgi:phenylalanyl-tRNA synthetase beta chain